MALKRGCDGRIQKGGHWREPRPWWKKEWLENEYLNNKRSAKEIAVEYGTTENNILYWLSKHGIKRRDMKEVRKEKYWGATGQSNPMFGKCAEANPHWLGGVSPERQTMYARAMWKEIKRSVLERDNFTCRRCGTRPVGHRNIHTHHPKTWKNNQMERFNPDNIITVCRKCHEFIHSRRNINREFLEP